MTKKAEKLMQSAFEERLLKQMSFDDLQEEDIENEREFFERKRERAMLNTVKAVIEKELDGVRKDIFVSMFFDSEKPADISIRLGIAPSTVYKHYHKALEILEENLKYVLFYCKGCNDKLTKLGDMQKRARDSAESVYISAIPMRLRRLMEKQNVSLESMCMSGAFQKPRLENILLGKLTANADEIVLFCGFFGVSADYILKGDLT